MKNRRFTQLLGRASFLLLAAGAPLPPAFAAAPPAEFAPVFAGSEAAWQMGDAQGQFTPAMAAVRQADGRAVMSVKADELTLASGEDVRPGAAVEADLRFPDKSGQ